MAADRAAAEALFAAAARPSSNRNACHQANATSVFHRNLLTSVVEGGCASERGMHAGLKRKRVLKVTVLVADMPDSNFG